MRIAAVAIAAMLPLAPARAQQTYKWIDSDGNIHITSTPPPDDSPSRLPKQAPAAAEPPAPTPKAADRAEPPAPRRYEIGYLSREGNAQRVIVQVTFNRSVKAPMALDTGATGLIMSYELAEKLDLFSRDEGALKVLTAGIGGRAPAIRSIVDDVDVGGASQRYLPVTISKRLSDKFEGLVGMDFMSHYAMSIEPDKERVVLQERYLGPDVRGGHPESWWRACFADLRAWRDVWKAYLAMVERRLADGSGNHEQLVKLDEIARRQVGEADKLLDRLDRFASREAVPRHWR